MIELLQAAGGAVGEDALEKLEAALRPVEKYAVRFLEEVRAFHCSHSKLPVAAVLLSC